MCMKSITSISCRENNYASSNLIKKIKKLKTVPFLKKVTWPVFKVA